LVSDQTIPNVVYLKNIKKEWDKVLFVSTKNMESSKKNKSKAIFSAIGEVSHDILVVDENMLFDINKRLDEYFSKNSFDKVFVNVTGGTKIMSLAAYTFFKDKPYTENIVYLPIGSSSYKQIYPLGINGKAVDIPIVYKMGVVEYLEAVGHKIKDVGYTLSEEKSRIFFEQFFEKRDIFEKLTGILRKYREDKSARRKIKNSEDFPLIVELLKKLGLNADDFDFKKKRWVDYFSGGWFEEYVYSELKKLRDKGCIDDVKLNIKLDRLMEDEKVGNELDVLFTKNNSLSIIECKSGDLENSDLTNTFYKVAYLNKECGLSAASYLASLDKTVFDEKEELKKDIKAKSKVFQVAYVSLNDIKEKGLFNYFFERLKCK